MNRDAGERLVARLLEENGATLAVAESVTGGLIASRLTDVPGISRFFLEGIVSYSNKAKVRLLGCIEEELLHFGAVSAPVAEQMARGARTRSGATFAVSTTGIAGPSGGTPEKPVGLVWFGVSTPTKTFSHSVVFEGDRKKIKHRAADEAFRLLIEELKG